MDVEAVEVALDDLPGRGPVTVGIFLRELRGVWPLAASALEPRALWCARHMVLVGDRVHEPLAPMQTLSSRAGVDVHDREGALV